MTRALVVVDIQNDYFPGGAYPLHEPAAAATAAARLIAGFRSGGEAILHIQHVWDAPGAQFMVPGTHGVEIHADVTPRDDEPVLQKAQPNAFLGTDLEARLRGADIEELVVAGMMTSMCVDATVRAASDLGFTVTVAHDACAAPPLAFGGVEVPAEAVQAAFLAALDDSYASVVPVDAVLGTAGG